MKFLMKSMLILSAFCMFTNAFAMITIKLVDQNDYQNAGIIFAWPIFLLDGSFTNGGSFTASSSVTLPAYNSVGLSNAVNQSYKSYKFMASTLNTFTFEPPGHNKQGMKVSSCKIDLRHMTASNDLALEIQVSHVQDVNKDPISCSISRI